MGKIRPGNKLNSYLNGEWATHVRKRGEPIPTSGLRRAEDKRIVRLEIEDTPYVPGFFDDDHPRYDAEDRKWLGDTCCESDGWKNPETYQGYPDIESTKPLTQVKKIRRMSIARKRRMTRKRIQEQREIGYIRYQDWLHWRRSFPEDHIF